MYLGEEISVALFRPKAPAATSRPQRGLKVSEVAGLVSGLLGAAGAFRSAELGLLGAGVGSVLGLALWLAIFRESRIPRHAESTRRV
jgi:hypothetical protein